MIDLSQLRTTLDNARAWPLVEATLAWSLGALCVGWRLRSATRTVGAQLPLAACTGIGLSAGFAGYVSFGAAAGEAARIGWLRRALGAPFSRSIAALAIDRLADGASILVVALLALGSLPPLAHARTWTALALLLAAPLAIWAARRFAVPLRALARGALRAWPAALAGWALTILRMVLVARALGLSLDTRAACALALAGLAGGQAPTPGGVGAVELALFGTGELLHLPGAQLAAFVVADCALSVGLGAAAGALASLALLRTSTRSCSP